MWLKNTFIFCPYISIKPSTFCLISVFKYLGNGTQVQNENRTSDEAKPEAEINGTLVEPGLDAMTLDSIFSVLEDEPEHGNVRATTTPQPKESVFVRLANRIKVRSLICFYK